MSSPRDRVANLLGALSLHVADEIRRAVTLASGSSGVLADSIVVIRDHPGVTADWLGRALGLSQPGTVHLVRRLHDDELVDKRPGRDARSYALHLTASGDEVADRILTARRDAVLPLVQQMTRDEQQQLATIAAAVLTHTAPDDLHLAHVCRLCDRPTCSRCPAHAGYLQAQ
jgi:DNA-binding MarR family transcriptional regulator